VPRAAWGRAPTRARAGQRPGRTPRCACRRRRAMHLGRRAQHLNSPSLASRNHAHTSCTHWPPIKGSPPFPMQAHHLVGPPLTPPRRTCFPASSRHRPRLPSSPPNLPQGRTAACSSALHRCSPNFELRRSCRSGHAAGARRSHFKPSYRHQSLPCESNHTPVQRVDLPWPWITTGELTPTGEGTVVKRRGIFVNPGT
jgi:hypothetical protein